MYAIGVDSGTQSTKVVLADVETGRVVGRGSAPHALVPGLRPGESEQDPAVWIEALEKALRAALEQAKVDPRQVVALGVSGQQHGFVPLDGEGRVIRPAKLWNDTSTVIETEALVAALGGPKDVLEKLGLGLAVGFTASKILWLKKHEPANFARLATVLLPHNYINRFLTGRTHMEYGDASGTGLMDVRKRVWQDGAVEAVDASLHGKLPALSHPREPVGYVRKDLAEAFGLGRVLVSSGGGDNMMGAIGTGNVRPGVGTVSLGTSGTVYSYFAEPFFDPDGEIAAFCDSTGGWLPLLCTMNVTNTTEHWKSILGIGNEELGRLAGEVPPGSAGLFFLPFVDGERVPVLPEASGVLFGLDRRTFNAACVSRAVIEGTIFNLGYGFGRLRSLGLSPAQVRATGGGARNPLWLQVLADVFGTPVVTLREQEAAAFGAAVQAVWTWHLENGREVGIGELASRLVSLGDEGAEPRAENAAVYAESQARFNSLWRTLKPEFYKRPAS